ncbi:Ferredoxin subunit of nitrite reductase or a ring-hydroxylating dioxygenase [Saccharicrinis carchari]|uniref:Ferredoxin subunit of nitrite reductase or a ring-hydroxylating dioxygenase n=1 Tax=Saccharicrinis carchari TaxID=1168039 RepID=A0A521CP83_SACCC|nr:Rieske (2Fe-2S) protein [Saccharicrinis carchari]SMO61195.1 Ferredoxin subunit of nitrite reductase or a ring-hydroxylating dioxygenase [Saccharicrinis carchari]
MKNKLLIISILSLFLLVSCTDTEEIIPTRRFNAQIEGIDTDPRYNQENPFIIRRDSYGNLIGNAGVVIYKLPPDFYFVFDLMCPYEKNFGSLIEIEDDIFGVCPTCGSKYFLATEAGEKQEGPSDWPLYKYKSQILNGTLHIWN